MACHMVVLTKLEVVGYEIILTRRARVRNTQSAIFRSFFQLPFAGYRAMSKVYPKADESKFLMQ